MEQQKVPDQYVVPNVTTNLQERLQSMTQQILSRTRLQATIDRFHLYSRPHGLNGLLKSGDPVEQMRNDIKIELVEAPGHPGEFTAFKMRYSAGSPELAREVNSELTTLFIDENVKAQRQLSENTTAFLENQLADARANMAEQEAKVAAFKAKHLGNYPASWRAMSKSWQAFRLSCRTPSRRWTPPSNRSSIWSHCCNNTSRRKASLGGPEIRL